MFVYTTGRPDEQAGHDARTEELTTTDEAAVGS